MTIRRSLVTFALLFSAALSGAEPKTLRDVITTVRGAVRPADAMERMRHMYATDRWFTFPKFQETAEYIARSLRDSGLQQVELTGAPADGVTQAGFWTMPLAWDARSARLEIIEPALPPAERLLADYQAVPASLGMWSGSTAPAGVTAELVAVQERDPAAVAQMDLKGKIVVASDPRNIKAALAKAGAIGALNTMTENQALRDGRQWMNGWGDKGWAFIKGDAPLLSFSIAPRQSDLVRGLLAKGERVKVRAAVDSRYYSGTYPYVSAMIPGRDPAQEVLLLGHSFEQGAQDNATGVAAMMEALLTLRRLIGSGELPVPRRSIRFLAMGEMYGSMHYVTTHQDRMRRTVAALCLDTPAASYDLAGTEYTFHLNPHVATSWLDALTLRTAELYFPQVKRPWHQRPYTVGTDTFLSDPLIGVPTTWAYSGSGVPTHHNSEDTPDRVDQRSLRDITVLAASLLYFAANAEGEQADWLGEITLARALPLVTDAASAGAEQILSTQHTAELGLALFRAREQVTYLTARHAQAIDSVQQLSPSASLIPALKGELERHAQTQLQRLQEVAQRRAHVLGSTAAVKHAAPPEDEAMRTAATMVVVRKRPGTLPLDELPLEQREGFPSGVWSVVPITALYWCDGQRPLSEVMRLTRLELGPDFFDYVGYFRFLARHGYVEIKPASAGRGSSGLLP